MMQQSNAGQTLIAITALAVAPAAHGQTPCQTVATALRHPLTGALHGTFADAAANASPNIIKLDAAVGQGWTLESTYVGSLHCQVPRLLRKSRGTTTEFSLPKQFAAGEGGHCLNDQVRLESTNGIAGVLNEVGLTTPAGGSSTIAITSLTASGWSTTCSLKIITTTPGYRLVHSDCPGAGCGPLDALAVTFANEHHGLTPAKHLPTEADLPATLRPAYSHLAYFAQDDPGSVQAPTFFAPDQKLAPFEVPAFHGADPAREQQQESHCNWSFDGLGGKLFPIVLKHHLLLGKIGSDGFGLGAHAGSTTDALAIYKLSAGVLQPIGGFCIEPEPQTITSIHVN